MMKNTQAFPSTEEVMYEERVRDTIYYPGMTLRDYFAGQAITTMPITLQILKGTESNQRQNLENMAGWSYAIADAMLEAREWVEGTGEKL